ncbi:MAG: glycerophosphodiester phosphodiesterase [Promethearchaeota archaeon]
MDFKSGANNKTQKYDILRARQFYERPHILAHRMLVMQFPENTLLSLKRAIELRVDWVEFDVHVLKDGEIVSMHDSSVDRTTDGHGILSEMSWEQVEKLNAGKGYPYGFVTVPRVEEILEVISKAPYPLQAEMHIHNLEDPDVLYNLLEKYNVTNRCYFNTDMVALAQYIREDLKSDKAKISFNIATNNLNPWKKHILEYNISYLCVSLKFLTRELVMDAHEIRSENQVFVHSYPVQNEVQWQRMLDIGVDVIQTDYPEALKEFLIEKGYKFT